MKKIIVTCILFLGFFIGCCFGFKSNAYTLNNDGNLVSDNLCPIKVLTQNIGNTVVLGTYDAGTYSFSLNITQTNGNYEIRRIDNNKLLAISNLSGSVTFNLDSRTAICIVHNPINQVTSIMLNKGSTILPYEPYGQTFYSQQNYDKNYDRGFVNGFNPNYVAPFDISGWQLVVYVYDTLGESTPIEVDTDYEVSTYSNGWILDMLKLTTDIYNRYNPVYVDILLVNEYGLDTKQVPLFFKANAPYTYTYATTLKPQEWIVPYFSSTSDSSARYVYEINDIGNSFLGAVKISTLRQDTSGQVISIFNSGTQLISLGFDSSMFDSGYTNGYNEGLSIGTEQGYNNGYSDGLTTGTEQGYNSGYNSGYNNGYNQGYTDGSGSDNTLVGMMFAIVDAPFQILKESMNFNFLGVNISEFIFSLITLIVVIKIFKMFF